MHHSRLLAILFLFVAFPVFGQEGVPTISLRLRPLSFQSVKGDGVVYVHDLAAPEETPGTEMKLKNYLNHEAVKVMARGKKLVVTGKQDQASARNKDEILGSFSLPDRVRWAVLLFLPGADGKFQVMPLEDSTRTFPRGSIRVLNMTRFPVRMQMEKKLFELKTGANVVIEDPPMGENNHASLRIFVQQEKEWRRIGSSTLPHPGSRRLIQLIFENPKTGRVELKGIRDVSVTDHPE